MSRSVPSVLGQSQAGWECSIKRHLVGHDKCIGNRPWTGKGQLPQEMEPTLGGKLCPLSVPLAADANAMPTF